MPYRFAYNKEALAKIKKYRAQHDRNSKEIQKSYDKLKSDPQTCGMRKQGLLSTYFCIHLGDHPEFRLFYLVHVCCCIPIVCKSKPIKNCSGLIEIISFVTREQANRIYNGRASLSSRFTL